MMDILLDLRGPEHFQTLRDIVQKDVPNIYVMKSINPLVIAVIHYKPPVCMRMFKDQQWIIFTGPNIINLIDMFDELTRLYLSVERNTILQEYTTQCRMFLAETQYKSFIS